MTRRQLTPKKTTPSIASKSNKHQLVEAFGVDPSLAQKKLQSNKDLVAAFCEGTGPGTLRFYYQVRFMGGRGGKDERGGEADGGGREIGRERDTGPLLLR